jgi:hypothetical protein
MSTSRAVIAFVFFCVGAVTIAPLLGHVDVWWFILAGASLTAGSVLVCRYRKAANR